MHTKPIEHIKALIGTNSSITGEGFRARLNYIANLHKDLVVGSIKTGEIAFDWTVPKEWKIKSAYIEDITGNKILDFLDNNLHLINYSGPINKVVNLKELNEHLHSLPELPNAVPYITSYYNENWGFCIEHSKRLQLKDIDYKVVIDSELFDGELNYGEIKIQGKSEKEILISTYLCHPSMANNELSGPSIAIELINYIKSIKNRKYSYRIIFIPETIGSIVYLSRHLNVLKKNVIYGLNLTCLGDRGGISIMPTKYGDKPIDRLINYTLSDLGLTYKVHDYLQRGSDERQYTSPKVDLPVISLMRTKYGDFKEYHTSLDNLEYVDEDSLDHSLAVAERIIYVIEQNQVYSSCCFCEPQLGRRGLYPLIGTRINSEHSKNLLNFMAYSDEKNDLIDVARHLNINFDKAIKIRDILIEHKLIAEVNE